LASNLHDNYLLDHMTNSFDSHRICRHWRWEFLGLHLAYDQIPAGDAYGSQNMRHHAFAKDGRFATGHAKTPEGPEGPEYNAIWGQAYNSCKRRLSSRMLQHYAHSSRCPRRGVSSGPQMRDTASPTMQRNCLRQTPSFLPTQRRAGVQGMHHEHLLQCPGC
jgi:hypothetical protein